jgi:hypothetical protein
MRFSWWCRRTWRGIIKQGAKAPAAPRCTTESLQYITSQLKRNSNPDALGSVPPQVAGNASSIIRPAFRVLRSVSYRQGGRCRDGERTYAHTNPCFGVVLPGCSRAVDRQSQRARLSVDVVVFIRTISRSACLS